MNENAVSARRLAYISHLIFNHSHMPQAFYNVMFVFVLLHENLNDACIIAAEQKKDKGSHEMSITYFYIYITFDE